MTCGLPTSIGFARPSSTTICTGRSDFPNQVNNVLCFPYIFRGALDSGATTITDEMEIAAVHAIADLAQAEQSEVVAAAYAGATRAIRRGSNGRGMMYSGPKLIVSMP